MKKFIIKKMLCILYGDEWQNLYATQTHYYSIIDTAQNNIFGNEIIINS